MQRIGGLQIDDAQRLIILGVVGDDGVAIAGQDLSAMGNPPIAESVPAGVTARPPGRIALVAPMWPGGSDASADGAPAVQLEAKVSS